MLVAGSEDRVAQTFAESVDKVLNNIQCGDFYFTIIPQTPLFCICFPQRPRPDRSTGETEIGRGRGFIVWSSGSKADAIKGALASIIAFEEHEVRESFKYMGRRVFDPHDTTIDRLCEDFKG